MAKEHIPGCEALPDLISWRKRRMRHGSQLVVGVERWMVMVTEIYHDLNTLCIGPLLSLDALCDFFTFKSTVRSLDKM